jgi:hypothetical protein
MRKLWMGCVAFAWFATGPALGSVDPDECESDADCDEIEGLYCNLSDEPVDSGGCGQAEQGGTCELRPEQTED